VFLVRELQIHHPPSPVSDEETAGLVVSGSPISTKDNSFDFYNNSTWSTRILLALLYASYHTVVVGVFLDGVRFGVLALFGLSVLGIIFQLIFMKFKNNLIKAIFFHIGIDLGVVIALADSIGWIHIVK